jgi:hypothetical protein
MPRAYDTEYFLVDLEVPEDLLPLVMDTPRLLPGERQDDYFLLFEAMVTELIPELDLEWLLAIDLAWIFFEIQRYRRWKNAIILTNRRAALEEALVRTDPTYSSMGPSETFRAKIRMVADALEGDPNKDPGVAAQLKHYGYDSDALNAVAFMSGVASLATVEKFLASARQQLTTALREAAVRREFKLRAEQFQKRLLAEHRQLQASRQEKGDVDGAKTQK